MVDRLRLRSALVTVALVTTAACALKQHSQPPVVDNGEAWVAECGPNDAWDKPGPAYRVYGATYYVGTCGIASILIAGDDGHILIDGGTQRGGPMIAANIASLGFNVKDVKILLHSHEHFDHVGGLAFLQAESGARVIASTRSAPVLQSGVVAANDPQSGMHDPFAGVSVDATISHAEQVTLGTNTLTAFETPGHSPGALSWQWTACEADQCKTMVYIDSLSPISRDGYQFMLHPVYVAQYRAGLAALTGIECDFALTPHPVASAMHQRLSAPGGLEDENGCRDYIDRIKRRLDRRLVDEHAGSGA